MSVSGLWCKQLTIFSLMCGYATRTTSNDNLCLIDILICSVCLLSLFFPPLKKLTSIGLYGVEQKLCLFGSAYWEKLTVMQWCCCAWILLSSDCSVLMIGELFEDKEKWASKTGWKQEYALQRLPNKVTEHKWYSFGWSNSEKVWEQEVRNDT